MKRSTYEHLAPELDRAQAMTVAEAKNRVLPIYAQLAAQADEFSARAAQRSDVHCGRGCSACCVGGLSAGPLEAFRLREALRDLDEGARKRLRQRSAEVQAGDEACVFLVDDACLVYDARPMVCRTQGLPLIYAQGTLGDASSAVLGDGRELTWCPLNYEDAPPSPAEMLDAQRLDEAMVQLNHVFAEGDEAPRTSLVVLAQACLSDR